MVNVKKSSRRLVERMHRHRSRRFHAYCVGAAKTGTTSIASSFAAYRTLHEPEPLQTTRLVIDYLEKKIDNNTLQVRLKERDKRLRLEMESAHPLAYLAGALAETFPEALFIVTLREPMSWLYSRLNFHHKVDPPAWKEYRDYFWNRHNNGFTPEESVLQEHGLCSLDSYLSQYADHYQRIFQQIPPERSLLIKTSEIQRSLTDIATFIGIDSVKLDASHSKLSSDKIMPLDQMDAAYVKDRIWAHCGDLIMQYFPENIGAYQSKSM